MVLLTERLPSTERSAVQVSGDYPGTVRLKPYQGTPAERPDKGVRADPAR